LKPVNKKEITHIESVSDQLSIYTLDNYKKYILNIGEFNNNKPSIFKIFNELSMIDVEKDVLEINVASIGGFIVEMQQYINLLTDLETRFVKADRLSSINIKITSHASSSGAYTFIALSNRYIYPNSRIMFHHATGSVQGLMHKQVDKVKFNKKHLDKVMSTVKRFLTKKEWKQLCNGKDHWYTAEDMLERGICTGIYIDGILYNNKKGIKKLKKYRSKNNKYFKKK